MEKSGVPSVRTKYEKYDQSWAKNVKIAKMATPMLDQ